VEIRYNSSLKLKGEKMKSITALAVILVIALNANIGLQAQSNKYKNVTQQSIETLRQGIKSDNPGLRKSSIYMAGLYKIDEAVGALTEQLTKEKNPGIRILIALSLYNIGDAEGMEAVKELAYRDGDREVKRMSTVLYRDYLSEEE
jgi:hypothetical protein